MKKTEVKLNDGTISYTLVAEEGKTLRLKQTGWITRSVFLDYTCLDGKNLVLLKPEDFEEIEDNN